MKTLNRLKVRLLTQCFAVLAAGCAPVLAQAAGAVCGALFTNSLVPATPIEFQVKEGRVPKEELRSFEAVIASVNAMVSAELDVPKKITVGIYQQGGYWAFTPEDRILIAMHFGPGGEVEEDAMVAAKPYRKSPAAARRAFAHEYGHLIFHTNLLRSGNPLEIQLRQIAALTIEVNQELVALRAERDRLVRDVSGQVDALEPSARSRYDALRAQVTELEMALLGLGLKRMSSVAILNPFDEMMADLVAFLNFDDGKAISHVFRYQNDVDASGREHATYRDATVDWSTRAYPKDNYYYALNPFRSFVWENYGRRLKGSSKGKARLLRIVFEAFDAEIRQIAETSARHWQEGLNERLIARVRQAAEREKL